MEDDHVQKVTAVEKVSEIFAHNMRLYMQENDISGNALASRSGIPQKTLWVTMNRKNIPTLDTADKICQALSVDLRVMLSRRLSAHEVQRTKRVGAILDTLISLPSDKLGSARDIVEAFAK